MTAFDGGRESWEEPSSSWLSDAFCLLCVGINIFLWPLIFWAVL